MSILDFPPAFVVFCWVGVRSGRNSKDKFADVHCPSSHNYSDYNGIGIHAVGVRASQSAIVNLTDLRTVPSNGVRLSVMCIIFGSLLAAM